MPELKSQEQDGRRTEARCFIARSGETIAALGLFDPEFYRSQFPEDGEAQADPLMHYLMVGWLRCALPHRGFNVEDIDARYGAARFTGEITSPLEAYIRVGRFFGLEFSGEPARAEIRRKIGTPLLPVASARACFVVHAFYVGEFQQICSRIAMAKVAADLIVTTSRDPETIRSAATAAGVQPVLVQWVPNIGRDVFPFVHLINHGLLGNYEYICKLHTKRSEHHPEARLWFDRLLNACVTGDASQRCMETLETDGSVGMITAKGFVGSSENLEQNWKDLRWLAATSGYRIAKKDVIFPVGSMFWSRSEALEPVLRARLTVDDFQMEAGQLDGTLAHAMERFFGVACTQSGFRISSVAS